MTITRGKTIDTTPVLTDEIKDILNIFSRNRTMSVNFTNHAGITLMASKRLANQRISVRLDMHYNGAGGWRSRFLEALPHLREVQEPASDKLSNEVRKILLDRSRPGCPYIFTQEQVMKVTGLTYKAPSDFGYEVNQWSLNLLVKEIHRQGAVQDISMKLVNCFLKGSQTKTP